MNLLTVHSATPMQKLAHSPIGIDISQQEQKRNEFTVARGGSTQREYDSFSAEKHGSKRYVVIPCNIQWHVVQNRANARQMLIGTTNNPLSDVECTQIHIHTHYTAMLTLVLTRFLCSCGIILHAIMAYVTCAYCIGVTLLRLAYKKKLSHVLLNRLRPLEEFQEETRSKIIVRQKKS